VTALTALAARTAPGRTRSRSGPARTRPRSTPSIPPSPGAPAPPGPDDRGLQRTTDLLARLPAGLLARLDDTWYENFSAWARAHPGGHVGTTGGWRIASLGSPWPFYNVATAVSEGFAAAGGNADDLTAAFADAAGYRVWLRDGMDDAEAVLRAADFAAIDELPAFWMPLSEVNDWPTPEGYQLLVAGTDDEVVECLLGDRWAGYMDDAEVARTFPDPAAMARVGDRSFYLGRKDGQLVATGQTIAIGGVVGTYGLWTAEPHRRRGLGNAILARGLLDARTQGNEIASIQASEMGAGMYQRAGFRRFCNYRIFRPPL
jgi:hypothetical protein